MSKRKTVRKPVSSRIVSAIKRCKEFKQNYVDELKLLRALPHVEGIGHIWFNTYAKELQINADGSAVGLAKSLLKEMRPQYVASGLRIPMIRKAFDEGTGKMKWSMPHPNGSSCRIVVSGDDPKCKVKRLTRDVHIPASEAYTDTRTSYVIENPEQCLGSK